MKKTFLYLLTGLVAGSLSLASCKKDEDQNQLQTAELTEVEDHNQMEAEADDATEPADDALDHFAARLNGTATPGDNSYRPAGHCWTATLYPAVDSIIITFDSTCQGRNGKYRRGKLLVHYTPNFRQTPGATITTTPAHYYVSRTPFSASNPGNRVRGVRTVMNLSVTADSVMLREGEINFTDGTTATWTADKRREWTAGAGTESAQDDEFAITKMHKQGSTRHARQFTADALTPVLWKRACWLNNRIYNPVQGQVVVKVQGRPDRLLDYGPGTCDNTATLTVGNRTRTIQLR